MSQPQGSSNVIDSDIELTLSVVEPALIASDVPEVGQESAASKNTGQAQNLYTTTQHDFTTSTTQQRRLWLSRLNPLKRRSPPPVPERRGISGEYDANLLSKLYFQWMIPLMSVGYRRPLELTDIWQVNPDRAVDVLSTKFKQSLAARRAGPLNKLDPLVLALYDTFKVEFIIGGVCQLIAGVIQVITPFVLKYLIIYVQDAYNAQFDDGTVPSIANGIGFVIGIACLQIVQSLCMNHYYYNGMMMGAQARSILISNILEKSINFSGRAKTGSEDNKDGWSDGRINGLMSTDTSRLDSACASIHRIWVAPIQLILALILLCINLTYSALVGFALICICVPLLGRAVKSLLSRRETINKVTDKRNQLTQETFSAIRFVKFFSWEPKLISRLDSVRTEEIQKLNILLAIRNAFLVLAGLMPILASMLTFITFALSQHSLDPAPVFSSLALFNALGVPMEIMTTAVGRVVDALASAKRISQFLNAEETRRDTAIDPKQEHAVLLDHASFVWEQSISKSGAAVKKPIPNEAVDNSLDENASSLTPASSLTQQSDQPFGIHDLSLAVGRREFIAVIGTVGSGKSSLIAALAGEMRQVAGTLSFGASKALCSQTPWIQNTTFQQNILFGKRYDAEMYRKVIEACALQPDIDLLPDGDMTEIGEKGVTISGGQKQRLNIARAIYYDSDIVLLDDPLSAVDAHVGRHMLDHAICGLLSDKCRILVTHQLHVLHRADRIVWMKNGRIFKVATFSDLIANNGEFQTMMSSNSREEMIEEANKPVEKTVAAAKQPAVVLMQQEEKASGSAGLSTWFAFSRASGSVFNIAVVLGTLAIAQGSSIVTNLWLAWWTSDHFPNLTSGHYVGIYAALCVVQASLLFLYASVLTALCTRAGKKLLLQGWIHVLGAPMSFFDTTPLGRITNRFSKDVDTIDNRLTDNLRYLLYAIAAVVSVFALIIAYFYYFVVALVPLFLAFILASTFYRASAREIKRFEANLRSIVFAQFGEAVSGSTTIRAYGVQNRFLSRLSKALDSMDGAYFLTFAGQRWLSTRLDTLGSLLIFVTGILVVTARFRVSPSISGLVLSYLLSVVQLIQVIVQMYAEVENDVNSVERLHYYCHGLEQEGSKKPVDVRPQWPEQGEIKIVDAEMRYRPSLPLVLKGLTVHIKPGEKVGIVGRTGAGKSSIISAIFRLTELSSGSITIDGMNIAALSLHDLRSRLSIIPQDPTLFRGTVRSNLDPFEEHDDGRLWDALRQAGLRDGENRLALESPVKEEGSNYSIGQRQLLALARILVKDSQIVLFDEATSSVDFETDKKVQETVLKAFQGKTLLCIAHRLRTVVGYDKILVMDAGKVAEYDTPSALYDSGGSFHAMCRKSGITRDEVASQTHLSE